MGSGAFPFPYPGMLQKQPSKKRRPEEGLPCSVPPESDQRIIDNLKRVGKKNRSSKIKNRETTSSRELSKIVQIGSEKSSETDTKVRKNMDNYRLNKNMSNFHLEPTEEPYGQMAVFGGINGQTLPPLTKMGGAKTLNARAADAAAEAARMAAAHARLANVPPAACSSFYNPTMNIKQQKPSNGFNNLAGNKHRITDSKSSTAAFWNRNKDSQFEMQDSENQRTKDKTSRPSTVTHVPQFGDDFKLPPIGETSHRGPLRKSESKDKVRRRGMRPSSGSEVSKIVNMFETEEHRTRDRDQRDGHGKDKRRKQKKENKDGYLAKRFSQATQLDSNIPIILEEDHPARMGKIRRMVKMFDHNAPTYQRSTTTTTTIDNMPSNSELLRQQQHSNSREYLSSNSSANVFYAQHQQIYSARPDFNSRSSHNRDFKDAGRRQSRPSLMFHDQDEHKEMFVRRPSAESYTNFGQQNSGGSQTKLPAFLKTGKKPAWMMGDRVEVQMEVQEKWDMVNSELRSKMKRGKGKSTTSVFRNCRDVHVHTEEYYEAMLSEDQEGSSDGELDF